MSTTATRFPSPERMPGPTSLSIGSILSPSPVVCSARNSVSRGRHASSHAGKGKRLRGSSLSASGRRLASAEACSPIFAPDGNQDGQGDAYQREVYDGQRPWCGTRAGV